MTLSVVQGGVVFPTTINRSRRQEVAFYAFMAALLLLLATTVGLAFQYTLPAPNLVRLGSLADFPPSATPYPFVEEAANVYIVNTGRELLALDPTTPHSQRCAVRWILVNQRFEDPCSGSKFAINGGYIEGPAFAHLGRLAIYVEKDGAVYLDPTHSLQDSLAEFIQRCREAQPELAFPGQILCNR